MGQPKVPQTPQGISLAGKTALITGGNTGLGFETARQFLLLGVSHLIITARTKEKGEAAVQVLSNLPDVRSSNPQAVIEAYEVELEDWRSIIKFCQTVTTSLNELHILVQNAGVNVADRRVSKTGHELTMQVNCHSPFIISKLLLPLLQSTARSTNDTSSLVFVGSGMQYKHSLTKTPIGANDSIIAHFDKPAGGIQKYCDSKLLVNAFVRKLASQVSVSEVVVNNLCPGLVTTELGRDFPIWLKPVMHAYRWMFARSVEEGARTIVFAAAVAGGETHGKFLQQNEIDPGAPVLNEREAIELIDRLWDEMEIEAAGLTKKYGLA